MLDLIEPELIFSGFKIATFAEAEIVLAATDHSEALFYSKDSPYGLLCDCSMGVSNGKIDWVAPSVQLPEFPQLANLVKGHGRVITPGLVDCHTHLVYGGNRANEWESRLTGISYEEISRQGGGILSSVRSTRAASLEELVESAKPRLSRIMEEGVTTVEIKSGYGLDLETEIKMLTAAQQLGIDSEVDIVTTLLAAHATPPEFKGKSDVYVDLICDEFIPAAKDLCNAVDAFCESIAFDVAQTKRVFDAAMKQGMDIKVHGEQLTHTGISAIASEMGALSADHLEYLTPEDCEVMGQNQTVATLLPGAFYCLNEKQIPPIEALRQYNVPIALATDCNPGSSPVTSLLLMANMGCNLFGLTPEESLRAITANAAKALGLQDRIGTLQPGRDANLVIWDVQSPAEIVYGVGHNPCRAVYRKGKLTLGTVH